MREDARASNKTYIIRRDGITGVFYGPNLISAWDSMTGLIVNLWYAYVILTRDAALAQDPPPKGESP